MPFVLRGQEGIDLIAAPLGLQAGQHLHRQDRWADGNVLQRYGSGDAYSVWALRRHGRFDRWYINFEKPFHRGAGDFDTDDHGLDVVVREREWQWKDRDDVAKQVAEVRLTTAEADEVWREAECVASALNSGNCWWIPRWQGCP